MECKFVSLLDRQITKNDRLAQANFKIKLMDQSKLILKTLINLASTEGKTAILLQLRCMDGIDHGTVDVLLVSCGLVNINTESAAKFIDPEPHPCCHSPR